MTNKHLTHEELQQWVLEKTMADGDKGAHILQCGSCQLKAAQYELMFAGVKQQAPAVFDFDVTALVMQQLPKQRQQRPSLLISFIYFIVLSLLCIGGYLFGNNFVNLFSAIQPIIFGLLLTTVTILSLFIGIDLNKKYKRQLQQLNEVTV